MLKELIKIEKTPRKGLFALEWVVMGYLLFTTLFIIFASSRLHNMDAMLWGRLRVVATTLAVYVVYRLLPCRLTRLVRVVVQMALLSWWYPDTYELNRILPNLDHLFAQFDQTLFGCQPALLFHQALPWHWFSELMDLGYASYYPMIAVVAVSRWHEKELAKAKEEAERKAQRELDSLAEATRNHYIDAICDCLKEQAKNGDKERQAYIDFLKEQAGLQTCIESKGTHNGE